MKYLDNLGNKHNRLSGAYFSDVTMCCVKQTSRLMSSIKNKKNSMVSKIKNVNILKQDIPTDTNEGTKVEVDPRIDYNAENK